MLFDDDDVNRILKIVDETEHLDEIELVMGDVRLHVRRSGAGPHAGAPTPFEVTSAHSTASAVNNALSEAAPVALAARSTPGHATTGPQIPEGTSAVRAPMLGAFYRSPAPGEAPFVQVGQRVKAADTVCLIEVMKLFNSIKAGVDGVVVKILVEDAALVEFRQPLLLIEPVEASD